MVFTENTKILFIVGIVLILLYLVYRSDSSNNSDYNTNAPDASNAPVINDDEHFSGSDALSDDDSIDSVESIQQQQQPREVITEYKSSVEKPSGEYTEVKVTTDTKEIMRDDDVDGSDDANANQEPGDELVLEEEVTTELSDADEIEKQKIMTKMYSKNKAKNAYKVSNYNNGVRGGNLPLSLVPTTKEWEKYFNDNNNLMDNVPTGGASNSSFVPAGEGTSTGAGGNGTKSNVSNVVGIDDYARYKAGPGAGKKQSADELYNSANFLPKEMNNDWFEVMPEAINTMWLKVY